MVLPLTSVNAGTAHNLPSKDPAISHVNRSSGVSCGFLIMGDHENSLAKLLIEPTQEFQDRRCILAVEIAGRFVSQQDCRIVDKSPCYGYTLLLTSRERPGLVFHPIGNPQDIEDLIKLWAEMSASIPDVLNNSNIVFCAERWQQVVLLEHKTHGCFPERGSIRVRQTLQILSRDADIS